MTSEGQLISFESSVRFVEQAAGGPQVLSLRQGKPLITAPCFMSHNGGGTDTRGLTESVSTPSKSKPTE
jgi:hypothetical protein